MNFKFGCAQLRIVNNCVYVRAIGVEGARVFWKVHIFVLFLLTTLKTDASTFFKAQKILNSACCFIAVVLFFELLVIVIVGITIYGGPIYFPVPKHCMSTKFKKWVLKYFIGIIFWGQATMINVSEEPCSLLKADHQHLPFRHAICLNADTKSHILVFIFTLQDY